jgi:hypothetical protein
MKRKKGITDKRSVRTTFKLSEHTIEGLKELAEEYGVTFKEIFETICSNNLEPLFGDFPNDLKEKIKKTDQEELTVRKTFVISKYSRDLLTRFSNKYRLSRNLTLEYLFSSYQADRSMKTEHRAKKHKKALKRIEKIILIVERELKGFDEFLDYSDEHDAPIFDILNDVVLELILYLRTRIENELKYGTSIDLPAIIINSMSHLYERG